MRNKYLICFEKRDRMKFIGHLDLLRVTQRCIKRSKLPVAYSQGFNPHQLISFAHPLSVGMEGLAEYVEVEMEQDIFAEEIVKALNPVMPEGYRIIKARKMEENEKNPASLVRGAAFRVSLYDSKETGEAVKGIINSEEIVVEKKGKKGITEVNIRPLIYELAAVDENTIEMMLAQGSQINLKPDILISYLYSKMNIEYMPYKTGYVRKNLYKETAGGSFTDLFAFGNSGEVL